MESLSPLRINVYRSTPLCQKNGDVNTTKRIPLDAGGRELVDATNGTPTIAYNHLFPVNRYDAVIRRPRLSKHALVLIAEIHGTHVRGPMEKCDNLSSL